MTSIECVMNVHRERPEVLTASLRSLSSTAIEALGAGLDVRLTVALDNATSVQRDIIDRSLARLPFPSRVLVVDCGDPGTARNIAVAESDRPLIAFFDGDDLWSRNWLTRAAQELERVNDPDLCVMNAAFNVVFDERKVLEVSRNLHANGPIDPATYAVANFSTSQIVASRVLLTRCQFPQHFDGVGFGHEDWEWSRLAAAEGAIRRTAPRTVHFIRREAATMSRMRQIGTRFPRPVHRLVDLEPGDS